MSTGDWIDSTSNSPCPICSAVKWCSVSADGKTVCCRHEARGAYNSKTDVNGAEVHLHRLGDPSNSTSVPTPSSAVEPVACPPLVADRVYRALLQELLLSDPHRENLLNRGLTQDEIAKRGYKSFPAKGFSKIATKVRDVVGDDVMRVPGFILKDGENGKYLTLAAAPGIAIPVRNRDGQVIAIKIRADASDATGRCGRYFYMSSGKHGGPGSGSPIHVPLGVPKAARVVRLTEGELKADIATALTSVPTISAPGCSVWLTAIDVIGDIHPMIVRLAFDADCQTKPEVAKALIATWNELVGRNYVVEIERWDSNDGCKGIDDALAAKKEIKVLSGDDAIEELERIAATHGIKFSAPTSAFRCVEISKGTVYLSLGEPDADNRRLAVGIFDDVRHGDRIDSGSDISRSRFTKKFRKKAKINNDDDAELIDAALQRLAALGNHQDDGNGQSSNGGHRASGGGDAESQAKIAFEIACEGEIFHTPDGNAYTTVEVKGHFETWRVKSQVFKQYLAREFYLREKKAINAESIAAAINLTEANATFEGAEIPVYVRVAELDGKFYLDLGNREWQAIEISKDGWQVIDNPPVRFRRAKSGLALPAPIRGGSLDLLKSLLNVTTEDFRLIVGWMVNALYPRGPYPMLAFFAQQGSGKSNAAFMIRSVIDPNSAPLRSQPREERDLVITANNSWIVAYDNLSHIPVWLSDGMCRIATGGGMATRELYTNEEEVIFEVQRSQMITSIEEVADKSDLLDRCLVIQLAKIEKSKRRAEAEIRKEFAAAQPLILGALLDAMVGSMREIDNVKIDGLPRMADFAYRATAAESALGSPTGSFMAAYEGNRDAATLIALESSVVSAPILNLLEGRTEWEGSASELLKILNGGLDDSNRRQKKWPADARALSAAITRIAPNLSEIGWEVAHLRDSDRDRGRRIRFRRTPGFSVRSVRSVRDEPEASDCRTQNTVSDAADAKSANTSADATAPLEHDVDEAQIDHGEDFTYDPDREQNF